MLLMEHDHVVQQVSAATPHPTLGNSILPRTTKGSAHGLPFHILRRRNYVLAKFRVVVKKQEPVCWGVRPRFPHLLDDPQSTGIARDVAAQDLAPIMPDDEEAVKVAKRERRHSEEVHRCNNIAMISQEREPALNGMRTSGSALKPPRDRRLGEIETQLEQLSVNSRRSPRRIFTGHAEDQGLELWAHRFPAAHPSGSRQPSPVQAKARAMPRHHGSRGHQHERLFPAGPDTSQGNPEELMHGRQSLTRTFRIQS